MFRKCLEFLTFSLENLENCLEFSKILKKSKKIITKRLEFENTRFFVFRKVFNCLENFKNSLEHFENSLETSKKFRILYNSLETVSKMLKKAVFQSVDPL